MWAKKHEKCVKCGTTEIKHSSKGMCRKCYYKKYYKNNTERIKELHEKWQQINPEEARKKNGESQKKWRKNNLNKFKEQRRKYWRKKYYNNLHFKVKLSFSSSIRKKLKHRFSSKNYKSTFSFLPYTVDDLIRHLENLFKPGMSWTNYGDWHIDHIRPDCKFNYKSVEDEEFHKCWELENLQPLWAEENLRKSGKSFY